MADMRTFNTRIKLRIDTLENWQNSSATLLPGEVAFATVAATAGNGLTEPVIMAKVATEEGKTFAELPWAFHAKSSDVLAACKSEDTLKAFINGVIADAGIASNEAMEALAAKVTTAEGKITALEGLVGDTKVATQISDAITALDLANTYEVKGEAAKVQTELNTYKTSNDAAVQKNATDIAGEITRAKAAEEANANAIAAIKDGTTIDSFADVESALAGKEAAGEAAKAEAAAKAYADGLAGNYDAAGSAAAVDAKLTAEVERATAAEGKALTDAKAYTDSEMTRLVGDTPVTTQIANGIANKSDKGHKHVKADITDFAHTHEMSEVNGLEAALEGKQAVGDYATKAEAQAMADGKDAAIAAAQKAGDDAQADVDALEGVVGALPEGEESVVKYIEKKTANIASDATVTAIGNRVTALETKVGDTPVADQISAAVKEEADRAKGIEGGLETRLAAVEGDYLKAADKKELQDQIDANESAIELLTNGVKADEVDGVNDLIQYVKEHGTEVTGIKADIKANSDAIAAEKERAEGIEGGLDARLKDVEAAIGESGSVADDIAAAVTEAKGYTDAEVKKLAEGAVATNAGAIDALEELVGDTKVADQISTAVAAEAEIARAAEKANADDIDALEAKAHEHANKTVLDGVSAEKVAAWDAAVQSVTPGTGLKATKTGTDVAIDFDEEVVFIFDCGSSAE